MRGAGWHCRWGGSCWAGCGWTSDSVCVLNVHGRVDSATTASDRVLLSFVYLRSNFNLLIHSSLVPIRCGLFIDKILAEFENPQQNCTTTSGAFRSTTPVTLCDKP